METTFVLLMQLVVVAVSTLFGAMLGRAVWPLVRRLQERAALRMRRRESIA